MFKTKPKNQYGTFHATKKRLTKTMRVFITALLAVIFVSGLTIALFRQSHKPKIQQATETISDQIPGWWYQQYFHSSVCTLDNCKPDSDPDQDKLTNAQEYYYHSDPLNAHTVGDKLTDGQLVAQNFDPSKPGKIPFNQVVTDDTIMGEGLVFDSDITKMINEQVNPTSLQLPTVNTADLKVSTDNSATVIQAYVTANKKIMDKYFPSGSSDMISQIAAAPDPESVSELRKTCQMAEQEMKTLTVPSQFLQAHKYNIMILELLPDVVNVPPASALANDVDPAGNAWFDKTQALMSVYQKLDLESKRLATLYK